MNQPPSRLGGARVIRYSSIDHRHRPTGACKHTVGGMVQPAFSGLAICQVDGENSFYLFYCDDAWNVVTDTWHATIEGAMHQAEFEYEHVSDTWQRCKE